MEDPPATEVQREMSQLFPMKLTSCLTRCPKSWSVEWKSETRYTRPTTLFARSSKETKQHSDGGCQKVEQVRCCKIYHQEQKLKQQNRA